MVSLFRYKENSEHSWGIYNLSQGPERRPVLRMAGDGQDATEGVSLRKSVRRGSVGAKEGEKIRRLFFLWEWGIHFLLGAPFAEVQSLFQLCPLISSLTCWVSALRFSIPLK